MCLQWRRMWFGGKNKNSERESVRVGVAPPLWTQSTDTPLFKETETRQLCPTKKEGTIQGRERERKPYLTSEKFTVLFEGGRGGMASFR